MYVYIYIYVYVCIYIHSYIYIALAWSSNSVCVQVMTQNPKHTLLGSECSAKLRFQKYRWVVAGIYQTCNRV